MLPQKNIVKSTSSNSEKNLNTNFILTYCKQNYIYLYYYLLKFSKKYLKQILLKN